MRSVKIRCLMAGIATHAIDTVPVLSALYILNVYVTVVALQRRVTSRVAILAARRGQDPVQLKESGARGVGVRLGSTRWQ